MSAPPLVALPDALAPEVYGGKAAGLATALRAGLPVPAGFAIAAEALSELAGGHASEGLRDTLDRMLAALGPGALAVRSSAVGEDAAAASFAGQHATVLGPRDAHGVRVALARVHDSAYTAEAAAYRRRLGLPQSPRIGAVLQRLIYADVAGVIFTRDPAAGEHIVVEASLGLGESVVTGLVTPDHFVLDRDGRLLGQRIGAKTAAVRADPASHTTRREPVAAELATRACLGQDELRRLADLARRAEDALGAGQDVEWALAGAELHLLQSRPIGTPKRPTDITPNQPDSHPSSSDPPHETEVPC